VDLRGEPALVAVLAAIAHGPADLVGQRAGGREGLALKFEQGQDDARVDAVVAGLPDQQLGEGVLPVADLERESLERAGLRVEERLDLGRVEAGLVGEALLVEERRRWDRRRRGCL